MLTTIEQKLSAIKAINEEKDRLDQYIIKLIGIEPSNIEAIRLEMSSSHVDPKFLIEEHTASEIRAVLINHFNARQEELIHSAQELMK